MAKMTGAQWAQEIRQRLGELKKACAGIDERTASSAPEGKWSPKMILSHLWGAEGSGHLPIFAAFLEQETPRLDLDPANPFFTEKRAGMTMAQLLSGAEEEYDRIARFAEALSAEQLMTKAHVPMLKESPLGEYPTLEALIETLGPSHLQFHTDHLREVLRLLQ